MLLLRAVKFNLYKNTFNVFKNYSSQSKWNVLFFGTDTFSLESLKRLHNEFTNGKTVKRLEIVTNVVGQKNDVLKFALKNDLVVHPWPIPPPSDESFHLGIVVSFGHLIPNAIITKFPIGMINVHASLLPRWRGAAPIVHCLLNGDTHTGVSIMKIKPHRFDVGDIIHQKEVEIKEDTLQPELHNLLANLGAESLIDCIRRLPDCLNDACPQRSDRATYAPKIKPSMAELLWEEMTSNRVCNLSKALYGIYHLETKFKNHHVKLKRLYLCTKDNQPDNYADQTMRRPGHFDFIKDKNIVRVWCKDNMCVYFNSIQVKGKREMSALDFRNGYMKNVPSNEMYFKRVN
ncbi:methionyl-tRNA formyltransferase, mitochondrial [Arctopsyche grandis]|uniref:methionyl-tRNA formyltransferase, mitochondrial n=1 Tax=Arctopsyche grandis TaxID=121162 RepID=UPI00406D868C